MSGLQINLMSGLPKLRILLALLAVLAVIIGVLALSLFASTGAFAGSGAVVTSSIEDAEYRTGGIADRWNQPEAGSWYRFRFDNNNSGAPNSTGPAAGG